jgi:hypothetical protein
MVVGGGASQIEEGAIPMAIIYPLALIGAGLFIYFLFVGASHALPLGLALASAFAARDVGANAPTIIMIGVTTFVAMIAVARFVILSVAGRTSRVAALLAFSLPAMIATFEVVRAVLDFVGVAGLIAALILAPIGAAAAVRRLTTNPSH